VAPEMPVLTGFCGTQDDAAVTRAWARAQLDAGADVLFTMLNGARSGAIDACRAVGAMQIGNVLDWTALEPDVFVASALARIDLAVEAAIAAAETGLREGQSISFSLDDDAGAGRMVDLVLRPDIEPRARSAVATARAELISGRLKIAER
jgi:basic membrane protein A and related proteins